MFLLSKGLHVFPLGVFMFHVHYGLQDSVGVN